MKYQHKNDLDNFKRSNINNIECFFGTSKGLLIFKIDSATTAKDY